MPLNPSVTDGRHGPLNTPMMLSGVGFFHLRLEAHGAGAGLDQLADVDGGHVVGEVARLLRVFADHDDGPWRGEVLRWASQVASVGARGGSSTDSNTLRHDRAVVQLPRVASWGTTLFIIFGCTKTPTDGAGDGAGSSSDAGDSGDDGGFIPADLVPEPSECSTIATVEDCLTAAFDARQACKSACPPATGCELDACEAVCFAEERMARTACYVDAGAECAQEVTISMCIQDCETAYGECIEMTEVDCYDTCDPGFGQCSTDCGAA